MRVLLRADAGVTQGTGHVMRMLTLAEALDARGHEAVLATADIPVDWLSARITAQGVRTLRCKRDSIDVDRLHSADADAVVLDGYRFDPTETAALQARFKTTLAVVDGDFLGYQATLFLDQNAGAERRMTDAPVGLLAGPRYALIRSDVLEARALRKAPTSASSGVPRLLAVLGGSDPFGAAEVVTKLLQRIPGKFTATVIHASSTALSSSSGDARIQLIPPTPHLPRLMSECDFAISAAGTTALDLLAAGVPTTLVQVAENQSAGYQAMVADGLAFGLGTIDEIKNDAQSAAERLGEQLSSPSEQREHALRGTLIVDGLGAQRVVRALESSVLQARDMQI